jgi:hypothetical protein
VFVYLLLRDYLRWVLYRDGHTDLFGVGPAEVRPGRGSAGKLLPVLRGPVIRWLRGWL